MAFRVLDLGFRVSGPPQKTFLLKDSYKETIIRNPKQVGYLGVKVTHRTLSRSLLYGLYLESSKAIPKKELLGGLWACSGLGFFIGLIRLDFGV